MKAMIIGIEISEGISRKSGKAYAIGTLHTMTALAPPMGGEGNVAKGSAGDKYEVPVEVLRKIQHLSFPLEAELERQDVIRFGERVQIITGINPLGLVRKAA
jgi:hypothetical protein